MQWLALVYIPVGLLLVLTALPLVGRRVAPNRWYGLRLPQTQRDPATWYAANAVAGRYLLAGGVVFTLVSVVLAWSPGVSTFEYVTICTAVLLGGVALALMKSLRYLQSTSDTQRDRGVH